MQIRGVPDFCRAREYFSQVCIGIRVGLGTVAENPFKRDCFIHVVDKVVRPATRAGATISVGVTKAKSQLRWQK